MMKSYGTLYGTWFTLYRDLHSIESKSRTMMKSYGTLYGTWFTLYRDLHSIESKSRTMMYHGTLSRELTFELLLTHARSRREAAAAADKIWQAFSKVHHDFTSNVCKSSLDP